MLTNINLLKCIKNSNSLVNYDDVYTQKIINISNKGGIRSKQQIHNKDSLNNDTLNKGQQAKQSEFAEIKQKDTLFWCYYIIKYGYDDYQMMKQDFSTEKVLRLIALVKFEKQRFTARL